MLCDRKSVADRDQKSRQDALDNSDDDSAPGCQRRRQFPPELVLTAACKHSRVSVEASTQPERAHEVELPMKRMTAECRPSPSGMNTVILESACPAIAARLTNKQHPMLTRRMTKVLHMTCVVSILRSQSQLTRSHSNAATLFEYQ